jgi:hypothetical protein
MVTRCPQDEDDKDITMEAKKVYRQRETVTKPTDKVGAPGMQ